METLRYEAPRSIEEAVAELAKGNGDARVLAGGTDLIVQMRHEDQPAVIVDVKRIPDLTRIDLDGKMLRLGAAASCAATRRPSVVGTLTQPG